jgi:multiple sugar transport system permease protein
MTTDIISTPVPVVAPAARRSRGLAEPVQDKVLRIVCYVISVVWCSFTVFPIYWLFTSTFKDAVDVNRMPPVFFPSLPSAYTVQLDFSDVAASDPQNLEQIIREDLALVVWRVPDLLPRIHLGKMVAEGWVNGRKVAGASLRMFDYSQYRGQLWPTQRLSDGLVKKEIERAHFPTNLQVDLNGSLPSKGAGKTATTAVNKVEALFENKIKLTGRVQAIGERTDLASLANNYIDAWRTPGRRYPNLHMWNYFTNGLTIAVAMILAHWLISGSAGYALSRLLNQKWSQLMTIFFLATMMVPSVTTLVPLYELTGKLGLHDSFWGVILPGIPGPFAIYLYKGFFDALPQDLLDAARIDGASEYRIFGQIVMPMSKNVFTVIGLLTFLASWNDFFWPLLILRSANKFTFTLAIYFGMVYAKLAPYLAGAMATAIIASVPTVIVFALFSRSIQQGLIWSGLKG